MAESIKIVAFIPARAGSKGLPDKNIKPLRGKPVLAYTIEAALGCSEITKVYVNSDSQKYLEVAEEHGASTYLRPKEFATDNASMKSVLQDFLLTLKDRGENYDAAIILYPVYPLRNSDDLKKIIFSYKNEANQRPIIGVRKPLTHPYLCYNLAEDKTISSALDFDINKHYRRQTYPKYYEITHWASIVPAARIKELNEQLMDKDTFGYYIDNEEALVNIDALIDFKFADFILGEKLDKS